MHYQIKALKVTMQKQSKRNFQLIWAGALILMGVAVFFRIPQVMPKLAEMGQSATTIGFIRICFYILGFILVGGGLKKIVDHFKPEETKSGGDPNDDKTFD
jgi:hypothetical protein